jgi:hypothetical protein
MPAAVRVTTAKPPRNQREISAKKTITKIINQLIQLDRRYKKVFSAKARKDMSLSGK